jgi:RNA polymerase sigma-70 factor (ECF subfamily)
MSLTPETRITLIQRLQHGGDDAAWEEFATIYRPVIVRFALRRQLQPADAEDLAQQVLLSVSRNIHKWKQDSARARFRTWLQTVIRNATINALSRKPRDQASGGTTAVRQLSQHPDREERSRFDAEWRQETFRWAAAQVREEFEAGTWIAFWETAVEGASAKEAAQKTGKTIGAVYIARTRVMQRIKQRIAELDQV